MNKDILVAILEDDLFSRNWMALLLVRDWRTRLVGEITNRIELCQYLDDSYHKIDILIIDVDLFAEDFTIEEVCENLTERQQSPKIVLTGIQPEEHIVRQLDNKQICGYVLKNEVGYSLSWVISFVFDGHWVLTPGTMALASDMNFISPPERLVLDGRKKIPGFTEHEAEVARLAFIFSLGRRDLADELKISEQWSYGLVSELYEKMGLSDILSGDEDLFSYIGESAIIRTHFQQIMAQLGTSKKAKDLETLAYHLLTMPEIID